MKKLLVLAIALLTMTGLCQAQTSVSTTYTITSTNVTTVAGLQTAITSLPFKTGFSKYYYNKGSPDSAITMQLQLCYFSLDSLPLLDLNYNGDIVNHDDITLGLHLIPVNNFVKSTLGKSGKLQIPILDTIASEYVDVEPEIGIGKNVSDGRWEFPVDVVLAQKQFSTGASTSVTKTAGIKQTKIEIVKTMVLTPEYDKLAQADVSQQVDPSLEK